MRFEEFMKIVSTGKAILCDNYDQRNDLMQYFHDHEIFGDSTLEADMGMECDRWLHPYYDSNCSEVHAYGEGYFESGDEIRFDDLAPAIYGDGIEIGCLSPVSDLYA